MRAFVAITIMALVFSLVNKYIFHGDRIDFALMLLGAILYRVNTSK